MPTLLTVKGLVIRKTDYGETSVLFDLLTDSGIRAVSAKGIRKPGSKYAAVTQLFSYGEFCLRQSGGKLYLDSAAPIDLFYGLRTDLTSLALASYFSELIRKTATDQPQPQLLRLFLHCLHYLSAEEKIRREEGEKAYQAELKKQKDHVDIIELKKKKVSDQSTKFRTQQMSYRGKISPMRRPSIPRPGGILLENQDIRCARQ